MMLRKVEGLAADFSLQGRTAVVTGSSSGLGRSIALRLARLGAAVVCCDLNARPPQRAGLGGAHEVPTHELILANGGEGHFQQVDVSDYASVDAAVQYAVQHVSTCQRLDIIVNNAGIGGHQLGAENAGIHTEDAQFAERVMRVNYMGVWNGSKAAIAQMRKQSILPFPCDADVCPELGDLMDIPAERGCRGVVINMGSIHGMVAGPCEPAYSASKGAVINLTRTLATDHAKDRITCNVICPGYLAAVMSGNEIPPEIMSRRITPWPHLGMARDVANAVIYLARDAPWTTGLVMAVDGGTTAM